MDGCATNAYREMLQIPTERKYFASVAAWKTKQKLLQAHKCIHVYWVLFRIALTPVHICVELIA